MKPLLATLVVAGAALALSGCPAKEAKDGLQDAGNASVAKCRDEFRNIETALEAFSLLENRPPANELEMVPLYLRTESPFYDISPTGVVVPAPGSACT